MSGVCKTTRKTRGEACSTGGMGVSFDCDAGLFCTTARGGVGATCERRARTGEACTEFAGQNSCEEELDCIRGKCAPIRVAKLGERCDPDHDRCGSGLFCRESDAMCRSLSVLAKGGDCGHAGTVCASGLYCSYDLTTHRCALPLAEGAPCRGEVCADRLFCSDDRCKRLLTLGQECHLLGDCSPGLECRGNNTCQPACR